MTRLYAIKKLNESSLTLHDRKLKKDFEVMFSGNDFYGLRDYCEEHKDKKLVAEIHFEGYGKDGLPVHPVLFKIQQWEYKV